MTAASRPCTPRSTAACWPAATARAHGRYEGARDRHHRPAGGEPLPLRSHRGQARLHTGRGHREHRHRRPCHGALRRQDLEGRGCGHRRRPVRRRAGRAESRRKTDATSCASPCPWPDSTALRNTTARSAITSPAFSLRTKALRGLRARARPVPGQSNGQFIKVQDLRYGENSHQQAALYRDLYPAPGSLVTGEQLQGKELSYNNIADADAAWECVKSFDAPACVIVKHANPAAWPWARMRTKLMPRPSRPTPPAPLAASSPSTAPVDKAAAEAVAKQFVEVLMAPDFTAEALEIFKPKVNVRLMKIALPARRQNQLGAGPQRHRIQARGLRPAAANR